MSSSLFPPKRSFRSLFVTFLAWKTLLGLVSWASPGIGYDTSSSLLEHVNSTELEDTAIALKSQLTKIVRWDAIYFTQIASRGYVFEQEWAFSLAFSRLVSFLSQVLPSTTSGSGLQATTSSAVLISHFAHAFSTVALYYLTNTIYGSSTMNTSPIPFTAALLHIFSPAGIILSAPYTESLFACLNMLGFVLYAKGTNRDGGDMSIGRRVQIVLSGLIFGFATTIRSNGLLSGLPFLYDAVLTGYAILKDGPRRRTLADLSVLIVGGLLVGAGLVIPQFMAYQSHCVDMIDQPRRPWCQTRIPSIYSWVQTHYWNVGIFRYWTLSNLPLFLLAAPMLLILGCSATKALNPILSSKKQTAKESQVGHSGKQAALFRLALPQLVLTILALTTYHVQIITRISAGYPLWYIWLAEQIVSSSTNGSKTLLSGNEEGVVRFMIIYAIIQGGLYASFLPPA